MDLPDIPGFRKETWSGFDGRPVCEWNSQFSNYRVQPSGKGYIVVGRVDDYNTAYLIYFDSFEEAVYFIKHKEIIKFFDDDTF